MLRYENLAVAALQLTKPVPLCFEPLRVDISASVRPAESKFSRYHVIVLVVVYEQDLLGAIFLCNFKAFGLHSAISATGFHYFGVPCLYVLQGDLPLVAELL